MENAFQYETTDETSEGSRRLYAGNRRLNFKTKSQSYAAADAETDKLREELAAIAGIDLRSYNVNTPTLHSLEIDDSDSTEYHCILKDPRSVLSPKEAAALPHPLDLEAIVALNADKEVSQPKYTADDDVPNSLPETLDDNKCLSPLAKGTSQNEQRKSSLPSLPTSPKDTSSPTKSTTSVVDAPRTPLYSWPSSPTPTMPFSPISGLSTPRK